MLQIGLDHAWATHLLLALFSAAIRIIMLYISWSWTECPVIDQSHRQISLPTTAKTCRQPPTSSPPCPIWLHGYNNKRAFSRQAVKILLLLFACLTSPHLCFSEKRVFSPSSNSINSGRHHLETDHFEALDLRADFDDLYL